MAVTTLIGSATGRPAHASTYTGCWGSAGTVTDYTGHSYPTKWCHNYMGGDLYHDLDDVGPSYASGYLYAGNNWFVCQAFGEADNPSVPGGYQNFFYLYTEGDVTKNYPAQHAWGWFPANKVSGGNDWEEIPNLPDCYSLAGFAGTHPRPPSQPGITTTPRVGR